MGYISYHAARLVIVISLASFDRFLFLHEEIGDIFDRRQFCLCRAFFLFLTWII